MSTAEPGRPRARIAEARRNRQKLIEVATQAFATETKPVALETIARRAGVGIGTLYRHFPNREALVEAIYADQIGQLSASAERLLASHPPAAALRRWTGTFLEWSAAKHGMAEALSRVVASGRITPSEMRGELVAALALFLDAGAAAGDLRADARAADVAALFAGVLVVAGAPDQRDQAQRMLYLIVDGLRPAVPGS
ncbi:putative TetR family transcriptional regulator [Actinocatenispora thailandica]|uniref:Putative TetR family transcriptional regulator n=1 Tax=Actinocatenispora thailandica TaxID=227318 RepID=A0A7R7DLB7_9ACTN|nr:TetR/AcrR family transcriptional regulator [Actinocatenispora thailandica]BCJ33467.1 putative TetR family transcriptional regulator [Actinocatenispora thailandica]